MQRLPTVLYYRRPALKEITLKSVSHGLLISHGSSTSMTPRGAEWRLKQEGGAHLSNCSARRSHGTTTSERPSATQLHRDSIPLSMLSPLFHRLFICLLDYRPSSRPPAQDNCEQTEDRFPLTATHSTPPGLSPTLFSLFGPWTMTTRSTLAVTA
jgi:hypothetical protein